MNHRSSLRRKHRHDHRKALTLILLAGLVTAVCGICAISIFRPARLDPSVVNIDWDDENQQKADAAAIEAATTSATDARTVYPYSVVPGGVRTPQELRDASASDSVVKEHYAGFDFPNARVIKVQKPQLVYLSYRIGDQVYWTTKQVSLHQGENLITDGKMTARGRCGNQVSALPQKKHAPQEPALAEFDKPVAGSSERIPFPANFHSALESRATPGWGPGALGPAGPLGLIASGSSPLGGGYLPVGSPLVPGKTTPAPGSGLGGGPGSNPSPGTGPGPGPGPGPGTPSVPVPEPRFLSLLLAEILGGSLVWGMVRRISQRHS